MIAPGSDDSGAFLLFDSIYTQVFAVFALLVLIFAYWKGEDQEKAGITAFVLAWFGTMAVQSNIGPYGVQYPIFAIDVVMLLVFAGLAWKSPRTWPVWAAGFQMFAVLGHVVALMGVAADVYSFHTLLSLAGYGVLGAIAVGTFFAWQERLAAGGDR